MIFSAVSGLGSPNGNIIATLILGSLSFCRQTVFACNPRYLGGLGGFQAGDQCGHLRPYLKNKGWDVVQ